MRILYLSPCAQLGGAERSLLDCMASLRAAEPRWELDLIAGEEGPMLAEARALGVRTQCVPFPARFLKLGSFGTPASSVAMQSLLASPAILDYRRHLHHAIQTLPPDLIHTSGLKMHVLGAWERSAPVVWHVQDYLTGRTSMSRALRLSGKRIRAVLATSKSVASDARRLLGQKPTVATLFNGVDLERFRPRGPKLDLDALSALPPACSGTVRVGLVGTFAKWKGHEVFLRALAQPLFRDLPLRAYIVGGPIYKTPNSQFSVPELKEMVNHLGLEGRVGLTGFVSDIPAAMRSLDILVHASTDPEPFGLVIAEAMACGRAVIAANTGGAAELVCNERDGLSITPGDPFLLAGALHDLVLDPVKRMCLARAARTTAEARFDRKRLGPELSSFYGGILNTRTLQTCASSTSIAEIGTAA